MGITQAGMARNLGISPSYLNLIEANKRTIGGRLLNELARALDMDLNALRGESQRQLIADLVEAAGDPSIRRLGIDASSVPELVGRFSGWAEALRNTLRAAHEQEGAIEALSNRLSQDPELSDALFRIITHVTAIRSTTEILKGGDDVTPKMRVRFETMVAEETTRLADTTQVIVRYFDQPDRAGRTANPIEEVDDYFIANTNYLASLEAAATNFRLVLKDYGTSLDLALEGYLMKEHQISVETEASSSTDLSLYHQKSWYDADQRQLLLLDSASPLTRRFQIAHWASALFAAEAIERQAAEGNFTSDTARQRAKRALASYTAGACLLPYEPFLADAEKYRYDLEQLRQRYAASFEQVAHRLVTLRKPGAEGIPFGFLRADPAGFLSKRFPLPGLPVPRSGAGCPLWAVFTAFQMPNRVIRQMVEFPSRARFMMIARTVSQDPARFHEEPFSRSVMLICDAIHADRTVYADGLDVSSRALTVPVGPGCRLCARTDCLHRAEDAILA